jgi:formate-dependent nitrite reductase cytochrome c552 subunit
VAVSLAAPAVAAKDSCYECHLNLRGKLRAPARTWSEDVHFKAGMTCTICHKGDAEQDELTKSKNSAFVGTFPRASIEKTCAECHGDPSKIHKTKPTKPADPRATWPVPADHEPATCIDCHLVHDTRKISDLLKPIQPGP